MRGQHQALTELAAAPDAQLVLFIQAGDVCAEDALRVLILRHSPSLHRAIRRKGFSSSEAQDIQQDLWLRAWQGLRRYEDRGVPFGAWLHGIARNVVREQFRRLVKFDFDTGVELDEIEAGEDLASELGEDLDRQATVARICELASTGPPDYFKWVEAALADLTPPEIMELYGWSRSKTDQTKLRAVAWIRKRWHEAGAALSPGIEQ